MNVLTGNKDADLIILDKLDDKTLVNFCIVNKEANRLCSIDSFWRNRLIKNYGNIQFKSRTWKQFYLSIFKYWHDDTNIAMRNAANGGLKDLVDFFISKGANDWNHGMWYAALGGHKDLVDFFISKGADNLDYGMKYAALGGHKDLVDFFISKGANGWYWGMIYAAEGGHQDLMIFFQQKLNEQ